MKPGIKSIIVGSVLFLLGAVVIPVLVFIPLIKGDPNAVQFKVPGTAEAIVDKPGRYYLWDDYRTVYEGKSYNRAKGIPDGMEIRMRQSDGDSFAFVSDASISSTVGNSSKQSVGYIEVATPGKVSIEVSGGNDERIFSFSQFQFLKMFGRIVGGMCVALLFVGGGLGLFVWGIVKLLRKKPEANA